ncbi:hypothetical protein [Nonomuraea sp. NPDC049709]|uniref:hypothetical protein n=1 Tax=Nonomuraea sp. NPDC049709 TaxID=3154736 RepID=UPI003442F1CB
MTTIVAVAVVAILVAAIGFVMVQQRWERIRRHVTRRNQAAPYEADDRSGAGQAPRATRPGRVATLDIKPLTSESRQSCLERWTTIQKQFALAPGRAVSAADRLVTATMTERGYPTDDLAHRQPEWPVAYGRTLHRYRQAHEISARAAQGSASTEDLRQAMVHYHVLFQDLLDDTGEHHPQFAERTSDDQPAPEGTPGSGPRKGGTT